MKLELIICALISFALSAIMGPLVIPVLRKIKAGQTERDDGPQSHLNKTGTPTMGAFVFLIPFIGVAAYLSYKHPAILPILVFTVANGLIGFCDDFIKVVLKRSMGLRAWQKTALQIVVALALILYMYFEKDGSFMAYIPFAGGKTVDFGWWNIPISLFIIVGTVNGSNLTDGVDGLETSVTAAMAAFFLVAAIGLQSEIAPVTSALFGALLGFLIYNVNKAKVFMGDTGSLALGGFVVAAAYSLHLELYLPLIALVYFVECVSVIIQVLYFKATHGKRFFKMAPIHHHFELSGWSETKVVGIFTIVTIMVSLLCMIFIPTTLF